MRLKRGIEVREVSISALTNVNLHFYYFMSRTFTLLEHLFIVLHFQVRKTKKKRFMKINVQSIYAFNIHTLNMNFSL